MIHWRTVEQGKGPEAKDQLEELQKGSDGVVDALGHSYRIQSAGDNLACVHCYDKTP